MATIGNFTKQDSSFVGSVTTLTVKTKVTISPIEKMGEKSPDFRVYAGNAEIGAAWSATSKEGKAYFSDIDADAPVRRSSPVWLRSVTPGWMLSIAARLRLEAGAVKGMM